MAQRGPQLGKVRESGFYYNKQLNRITQLTEGEFFPASGEWELIGTLRDTSADEALSRIQASHPDVAVELVFSKKG